MTQFLILTSLIIMSFDFVNDKLEINSELKLPSVNIKLSNEKIIYDEFDPSLPKTPPPPEINIVKFDDIKKGLMEDMFDIKDPSQIKYLDLVIKNAKEQNFDVELTLAIIKKESNFDPRAKSSVGAVGLMQLLPETAKWLGLKNLSKLTDPDINIKYGIKYLRYLFSVFGRDIDIAELKVGDASKQEFLKVLAAYNAGPGNVEKYDKPPYNGIPPFKETKDYVKKVPFYFINFEELNISK